MTFLDLGNNQESWRREECMCGRMRIIYVIRERDGEIIETSIHDCPNFQSVGLDGKRLLKYRDSTAYNDARIKIAWEAKD